MMMRMTVMMMMMMMTMMMMMMMMTTTTTTTIKINIIMFILLSYDERMAGGVENVSEEHVVSIFRKQKKGRLKQDSQCTYNVTLKPVRATIVAVEKQ
jgi:hypothetical protein